MFQAPLCPSSGAKDLYRWLLPVVLGALVYRSLVWCRAVGNVPDLRDAAQQHPANRTHIVETCSSVIICEIIVHLLAIIQNLKKIYIFFLFCNLSW